MRSPIAETLLLITGISGALCPTSLAQTESVRDMVNQARSQAKQGNHSRAAAILDRAKAMAPNSEEVLSDFAENSLAAGDPVGAINTLEPLTRMHPTVAKYPYLLGVALLQIKEFAPSVDQLQLSLELEPQRALTLIALGITFLSQKRFSEAEDVLLRSLEIEPENPEALAVLAEAEEGLGKLELAEIHAERVLAQMGPHSSTYFVLGRVRMSQGRYEEAIEYFLKAVAMVPDSPRTHYQLSLAYARINDLENSKKHRELHQAARSQNVEHVEMMRKRAGLKSSGMRQ